MRHKAETPTIGLDFEFVTFDDLTPARELKTRFALSMGISKRIQQTRKSKVTMHWNIAHDQATIRRTFKALHLANKRGLGSISKAIDMLMVSDSAATPAASHWLAALKAVENGGSISAFDNVAKELAFELNKMDDKLVGKLSLQGVRVIGSYLREADIGGGYVKDHISGQMAAGTTDIWNQANPAIKGSLDDITSTLGVNGPGQGDAFRNAIIGDVEAGLREQGISNTTPIHDPNIWNSQRGKYNDRLGIRKGYTGMEDLYLMTGGKSAHAAFVTKRMRQGTGNSDWSWGKGGYSDHGHGAMFDAVLSESIYEKLEAGLSSEDLAEGRKLIVKNRINAAHAYVQPSDATNAFNSSAETIAESVKTEGTGQSTGTTSKKRSNVRRMRTQYSDYGKKFNASDYASTLRKSRASQYMKGKWGFVAGIAAAGLLVGVASDEFYRNSQRRQMARNHISSEKLSQAMSLGGSR